MVFDNTYVEIDLDAITANIDAVRAKAGVPVMAVVKADAYGHGAIQVARLLKDKCSFFGVSSVAEALELRQAGLVNPILILGHTPIETYDLIIQENIRIAIFHYEDAVVLSREAQKLGKTAYFHFAVDTGMSRIGFQATAEAADTCAAIAKLPGLYAEGLFSHFATADSADLSKAQQQQQTFLHFDEMLRERGVEIPLRHMDNSAGLMNFSTRFEMVRSGIVTYGMYPSDQVSPALLPLKPALKWFSRVTHVKLLEPGREISYGGTYVTTRPTMVATIPVGYADGYRRSLSGEFYVLIRGHRAPILGRVCMDQMMVDVTDIPGVQVTDPVVLLGRDGEEEITIEQLAAAMDTIHYEVICGISRRMARYYRQNGKLIKKVHYLLDD